MIKDLMPDPKDWKEILGQEIYRARVQATIFTSAQDDINLLKDSKTQFVLLIYGEWPSLEDCKAISSLNNIVGVEIGILVGKEPPHDYEERFRELAKLPNVIYFETDDILLYQPINIPLGYPNLKHVFLRECELRQLPENIENCKELLYFEIERGSGSDFSQIGSDLARLNGCSKLRYLDLQDTKLREFPEALTQHPSLEAINLNDNEIAELPESIGQMKQLKALMVGGVIPRIPDSIGNLSQLRKLEISTEDATCLPESIGKLTQLQELSIYSELVTDIPESLANLSQLKKLKISGKIETLPEWLCQLKSLVYIDFSYNQITTLPEWLCRMPSLELIRFNDNQIQNISWDIGQLRQLPKLKAVWLDNNPLSDECKSRIHQAFPSNTKPGVYLDMTDYG